MGGKGSAHSTPYRAGSFFFGVCSPFLGELRQGTLPLRPWQQSLFSFSLPPVMQPEDFPRTGCMTLVSYSKPSMAPWYLVVESLWDTFGSESSLYHLLAAGCWASSLTAPSLSLLIYKMGMLSSCLIRWLRGVQRSKHLPKY